MVPLFLFFSLSPPSAPVPPTQVTSTCLGAVRDGPQTIHCLSRSIQVQSIQMAELVCCKFVKGIAQQTEGMQAPKKCATAQGIPTGTAEAYTLPSHINIHISKTLYTHRTTYKHRMSKAQCDAYLGRVTGLWSGQEHAGYEAG